MTNGLGLGDAYGVTIGRIKAQGGGRARLGIAALMWISCAERPLNTDEICHALAVEMGSTDINSNDVPLIQTVLSCCQGLAALDKRSSTIRLIHVTLKEYLSDRVDLFDGTHSRIAEVCLTYLNFQAIKKISASSSCSLRGTPFLIYSSLYWGTHMRMEFSDRSRCLALDLLDQYDDHISAKLLWESIVERRFGHLGPFSALHCISYFGIAEVAIDLVKTKRWDVNQRDSVGLTPLMWAAEYGREEVVKLLLLQKHTQPNLPDMEHGRTALSWAAGSGHVGVVRLLLGPLFADPESIAGKTQQIMNLLFGWKYVNPDRPDNRGRTPLLWAACNGHSGVVELLLGREEVIPDRPDSLGQTPLFWAAKNGHDGVVELLLEREEVIPDRPDNFSQTPLLWAAQNGHDGAVRLLLGRKDVSPDKPDNSGRTPLLWAAANGHCGVVKLLLDQEDVSPDRPNRHGKTPLLLAIQGGHGEVVELLKARMAAIPKRDVRP